MHVVKQYNSGIREISEYRFFSARDIRQTHEVEERKTICQDDSKLSQNLATLLCVGTIIGKTDLQFVHGGEKAYEPICYRHSY